MSAKAKPPSQPKKNKLSQKSLSAKTVKSARVAAIPASGKKESKQLAQLKQRASELAALQATVLDISSPRPLPELLNLVMERACNLLGASSGGIYLCDSENQQVRCVVSYKTERDFTGTLLKYGEGAAGTVAQSGKSLIIDDYRTWSGRAQIYDQAQSFSAVMAAPLLWQGNVTGVIDVIRSENLSPFTKENLELLNLFAAHAALAVENSRLYNMLEEDLNERKRTEDALRESEKQLRESQILASLGSYKLDIPSGKWTSSEALNKILGIKDKLEHTIEDWVALIHPNDRQIMVDYFYYEVIGKRRRFDKKYKIIKVDDNTEHWVHGLGELELNSQGQLIKMLGTIQDITERKMAEEAIQEAELKYRLLVEHLPVIVYTSELGMTGVWLYISPQIEQLLGFTADEWMANSELWYQQVHPEDRDRQEKLEQQAWVRREAFESEYRMFTRDGRLVWIRDSAQILPSQNNKSPVVQGVLMDITERKLAENARADSESELRALFASMQDVVLVIDREGVYRKIAPTNPDLLYKSSQEMLGKNLRDLLPAEQADLFFNVIQQVLMSQQTAQIEYSLPIGDHISWFSTSISPMDIDNTLWVARDITNRKQAEEALQKSDQRLQVFFNQSLDGFFFCNFEAPQEWKNAINKTNILEAIINTQHFTDVNDAMLKQYEISREKFLSFTTKDVFAHDIEQGRKLRRELFDNGRLHTETFERRSNGTPVWFEGDYVCLYDGHERITGFFGIQRDITERKLAERVQSALYEIANAAQTSVSLNDLFAFIHKTLQSFMPAKNFYISIYDSQKDLLSFPYFVDEFDKAPAPQKPVNGLTEYVLRTKQPLLATPQVFKDLIASKQVDLLGVPAFDWIGVPLSAANETFGVMVVQTYTDAVRLTQNDLEFLAFVSTQAAMVIKRKQAEETLLQFREVMDESNDAIYFIDPETSSYIDFNKNAMKSLGYNKEELSQLGVIDIAEHINNMEEWQARVELIGKSDGIVFQTSYQRKDDSLFPVEVSARILNHDGKPIMVAVVRDITDRTQAELARERQLQELTGLHAIASACAFAIDEDSLLTVASILIGEVLYPEDFGFFILDKDGLLRPHHSYHQKNGAPNKFINLGDGLIGQAAQEGRARRSGDVRLEKNYIVASPTSLSELAVPIKINERVLGVINAESNKLNAFSEADERLLSTAADQIATALERIRLQNETAQRAKEFASLYETSTALSAENNLTPLLQVIVEHAATLLGATTGAMYLFNKSTQDLVTMVATSADIPIGIHLSLGEGVAGRVAQTQLPLRIDDYSTWNGRSPKYEGLIFHAILEVPMLFGGELIGVLNAAEMGESKRKFTEADERLLSLFAAQAAGAIHSARLRAETDQRAQEFASLYETSKTLSTEQDLNKLLLSIVENARNLLHTATSGMYLTIPGTDEVELSMDTSPYIPLGSRMKFGEGVAGRVAQTRQPLRIDDYSTWEGRSVLYGNSPIRAVVEVPMLYHGELIGVLTADEAGDSERNFTEADEHLLTLFATQAAGAIHSARLLNETRRRAEEFTTLYETTHDLTMHQDLSIVLDIITSRATTLLRVPNAAIILYDPTHDDLKIVATRGPDLAIGTRRKLGEGLAGRVVQSRLPLIIDDYSKWEHRSHLYDSIPYTAMMGVPLLYGGNLLGVLDVSDIAPSKRTFNEADVRLLSLFAGQAASAIANAQLFDDLKKSNIDLMSAYDTTIEGWSRAMDLRDHETEGHTLRVTDLTLKLARGMHLSESQLIHIRRGSLLHDIGKMGVPDAILLKEGNLNDEEWIIMRKHPQLAYEMLSSIEYLHEALDIPSNHHEKWDGTGYPRGLKGEEIPLAARIFSVVDVWDAIRSDRPYRNGWDTQKAIEYIKSQSGTHFDPVIVEAFLNLVREQ